MPRLYPLVTLMDVTGVIAAVVARADVIPRQVVLASHPTGSWWRCSEQAPAALTLALTVSLHRGKFFTVTVTICDVHYDSPSRLRVQFDTVNFNCGAHRNPVRLFWSSCRDCPR